MSTMVSTAPAKRSLSAPCKIVDLVGKTPMIDLSDLVRRPDVRLYAKAEQANPGGSVKDRPGLAMVQEALASGVLSPGKRILDATSGNTGIAYAWVGAALGIPVTLCLPANASPERKRILKAYGVELVLTDPMAGSDGAILEARRLAAEKPELYAYLDQYGNDENWRAHYRTTGPEIWEQTAGEVTHFITGLGTSGTFMGVARCLKKLDATVRVISVEPDGPFHGLEGMKHMQSAIVPAIYDPELADEARSCSTEEAHATVRRLARDAGLMVGVSAGCNVSAALALSREIERGVIVTMICDGADKYLSDRFWEEE
jgi:cysteine synthase B